MATILLENSTEIDSNRHGEFVCWHQYTIIFQSQVLRIYKLNEEDVYQNDDINIQPRYSDYVKPKEVLLDNPVIDDFEFKCIYEEIHATLEQLKKTIDYFNYFEYPAFKKYD